MAKLWNFLQSSYNHSLVEIILTKTKIDKYYPRAKIVIRYSFMKASHRQILDEDGSDCDSNEHSSFTRYNIYLRPHNVYIFLYILPFVNPFSYDPFPIIKVI